MFGFASRPGNRRRLAPPRGSVVRVVHRPGWRGLPPASRARGRAPPRRGERRRALAGRAWASPPLEITNDESRQITHPLPAVGERGAVGANLEEIVYCKTWDMEGSRTRRPPG